MESRFHSSLHENCHHQIVFAKFNLKVLHPPPSKRKIWHFNYANVDHTRKAYSDFQRERLLANININEMVYFLIKLSKCFVKLYPKEVITCDDRDPPWI